MKELNAHQKEELNKILATKSWGKKTNAGYIPVIGRDEIPETFKTEKAAREYAEKIHLKSFSRYIWVMGVSEFAGVKAEPFKYR